MANTATQTEQLPTTDLGVHGAVCHVEFVVPDIDVAASFYGDLFAWQFMTKGDEAYFQTPGNGPCGCLSKGEAASCDKTVFYVTADSIDATLERTVELGGSIATPKTEIEGGHGYFAKIRGLDGNVIGIYNQSGN